MRMMENGVEECSQWFPGKDNQVADALSRDDDRSDQELTNVLRLFVPNQLPSHFKIVPLPNEIVSWLTSLLQKLPVKTRPREKHKRTNSGRWNDGRSIASPLDATIPFSSLCPEGTKSNSSEPLPWLCEKDDFRDHVMGPWLKAQSEVPFQMWLRPSGTMISQTQPRTKTATLADFCQDSSEPSETRTPLPSNKKLSQWESSEC